MSEDTGATPASPGIGRESSLRRLIGVFVSPARTFASIAARPTWILPVAIAAGLGLPLSELVLSRMDWRAVAAKQLANRHLSDAQMDSALETIRRIGWVFGDAAAVLLPLVLALVTAAVLWGACQAFGWEVRYKQSLGVTTHAFFPATLASVGLLAVLWNRETIDPEAIGDTLHTNLGFLVDPRTDKVLHSLAASVDLFAFWAMALLVLGLSSAAGASRRRVAILVGALWLLFVLGKAGVAAMRP
ncbi:MAG TPA: YIP1 family protein [Thermoanaerobaculia bacterium]|jgi:hypothetical protein